MQPHNGFNLQFPADIWYWTPFHVCLPPAHLQWTVCSYLLPIFQLGCLFFTVEFSEFSMCSDTSLLWDTYFVNTFSQSIAHSIISLTGSFTKQFLNFDGGKLIIFFPFINYEFGVQSKNSVYSRTCRFSLIHLKKIMVLHFICKSMIYIMLISIWGGRFR